MRKLFSWPAQGVALFVAAVFVAGCGSKPAVEEDPTRGQEPEVTTAPDEEQPPARDDTPVYVDPNVEYADVFQHIHFEFNKYRILPEDRPTLEGIASLLDKNPTWKVLIEGHCDERGTNEYNLGLGEQRAQSAKRYLVNLGVRAGRFQTVSYGEERPVALGHNEEAWSRNRRCEFRVEAPGS